MVTLLFKLLPFLIALYAGVYLILEVLFPWLRGSDFNRIDGRVGPYINIMGWRIVLPLSRVKGYGYRYISNGAACVLAIVVGVICIVIAIFGIRHVGGIPEFIPDLFARL